MRRLFSLACLLVSLSCVLSCKKNPEPQPTEQSQAPNEMKLDLPEPPAKPAAAAAPTAPDLKIAWQVPEGWRSVPSKSAVRKATYGIPKVAGDSEDAELAVFYFGASQGGSVDANAQRWIGQFSGVKDGEVKRADREVNGLRQHLVEVVKGTFSSGMPGDTGAKEGFGMLGAIVEAPSGSYFFKMTGPSTTVQSARGPFLALLDSIKPVN